MNPNINPAQLEHARLMLDKATNDYLLAQYHARRTWPVTFDAICFHSQQCVEKSLKAYIAASGYEYPFTHSLSDLLKVASGIDSSLSELREDCNYLTGFAVVPRYPDEISITADIATSAFNKTSSVFASMLKKLEQIDDSLLSDDAKGVFDSNSNF